MTLETKKGSFDLTFTGQATLKLVESGRTIRLLSFRVRGQNMVFPAELVLSLQPLPFSLKTLEVDESYIDQGKWVHYSMKADEVQKHPSLFEGTDAPDYLDKHLDLILDLKLYDLLRPGALSV